MDLYDTDGCRIPEGDVTDEVVSGCASLFPHLSSVIFTGVGEPLLHPKLNQYIEKAAALMPVKRTIGFQTNGKLLTREKAAGLLQSGMNKICISVDTVNPEVFDRVRNGGTLNDIYMALDALAFAKQETPGASLETGVIMFWKHRLPRTAISMTFLVVIATGDLGFWIAFYKSP